MWRKLSTLICLALPAFLHAAPRLWAQAPAPGSPNEPAATGSLPMPAPAAPTEPISPPPRVLRDFDYIVDTLPPPQEGVLYAAGQKLGWFGTIGAGLVVPHINNHVTSGTLLAPTFSTPVRVPVAPLAWTGMPQLDVGYRMGQGAGEFLASYRFLASEGSALLPAFDAAGAGLLKSRLNANRFNLSYVNHEFLLDRVPNLFRDIWAGIGFSAANVFFDSQAQGTQIIHQQASNNFAGIGPYGAFGLDKEVGSTPLVLYGRADAAGLLGKTRQHFEETALTSAGLVAAGASSGAQSNGVAVLGFESGFSVTPRPQCRRLRLSLGYRWERWWNVGNTTDSNADLTIQGFFLRGEFGY